MTELRYSDRTKMATDGSLGPLSFDTVPDSLRVAIRSLHDEAASAHTVGAYFKQRAQSKTEQHVGRHFYHTVSTSLGGWIEEAATVEELLDFSEIMVEEASTTWNFTIEGQSRPLTALHDIADRLNAIFVRHRFGYRIDGGQVHRIGSPALDETITGPALLATSRPGWEEADKSFRDALHHQRGGAAERAAAITDAHAALEAAMKAAGFDGNRLDALAKSLRNSGIVPSQLTGVPEALDTLLKRSSSIRDPLGDAHGKAPGAEQATDALVDLAIYWTGAFINFLAQAVPA